MYPPSTGPGDLVVANQHIEAARAPESEGAPLPGDARTVQVVVCHRDVLGVFVTQIVNAMVT